MLKVFTYMFSDKNFWKKYLALFAVVFVANSFINWSGIFSPDLNLGKVSPWYYILFFAGFIVFFFSYGHSMAILKTAIENKETNDLPMLNPLKDFISGTKVVISGGLFIAVLIAFFYVLGLFGQLLSLLNGTLSYIIQCAIIILVLLITAFSGIAMCCRYVVKPDYLNFFRFKAAFELINNNVKKYFLSFLLCGVILAVAYLLSVIFVTFLTKIGYAGLVLYCILVSLVWTYIIYVFAGLFCRAVEFEKEQ